MENDSVEIPLRFNISDSIITRFASHMVIQRVEGYSTKGIFKILFFEANQRIRLSEEEELPKECQANCVASIVVTAEKLSKFIKVLQQMNKENPS